MVLMGANGPRLPPRITTKPSIPRPTIKAPKKIIKKKPPANTVPGGNAVSGVWADKQMTAKAREATYESLHATASTRIQTLENMLEAERESNLLKFEEIESDKYSMLEVEELNQAAFDNVRSELKKSHGNLNADVNTLQSFVARSVDALTANFHDLRKTSEEQQMTAVKKNQLHAQIESNVMKTVLSSLEAQMNREFGNVKLDVRHSLTEVERSGVHQQNVMQQVERKLYEQQQQMFEIEKTQARMSVLYPAEEVIGAGGGGAHRISVMDFTLKGLVDRVNELENSVAARDERFLGLMKIEREKVEEQKQEAIAAMRAEIDAGKTDMSKMLDGVKVEIGKIVYDLETTGRADADVRNREAVTMARKAVGEVADVGVFVKRSVEGMETKLGRVRIDFDRMVGDTTAACEALAAGLSEVRAGVKGVGNEVRGAAYTQENWQQQAYSGTQGYQFR